MVTTLLLYVKLFIKIFCIIVGLINVYYVIAWIYSFNGMPTPASRVDRFLNLLVYFDSVVVADIFVLIITLASIILINFFRSAREYYRISLTAVHVCFLAYLGLTHI